MNMVVPFARPTVEATAPASALCAEALLGPGRLHGKVEIPDRNASVVETEKEWHKHLARYISMGMSFQDAAKMCDCSAQQVGKLARTPWFQARVEEYMKMGTQDIMSLFKASAFGAYVTLVEVCNNDKAANRDRITAAKELLERHLGKSTQHLEVSARPSQDPVAEVEALEKEVAMLQQNLSS